MSGACTAPTPSLMGEKCYLAARSHLEKAEMQIDGACPWNIETVQALTLIARYEFLNTSPARALLTTNRLVGLATLLGLDQLDQSDDDIDCPERFVNLELPLISPDRLHEARCTFWIAYAINCHAIANVGRSMTLETNEACKQIRTLLTY